MDKLEEPVGRCAPCPTWLGYVHGHDPESHQILMNHEWCLEMRDLGGIWCPWRNAECVTYPLEMDWAIQYHERGEIPPVRLHPAFEEESAD